MTNEKKEPSMSKYPQKLFELSGRITRSEYALWGFGLMGLKYLIEALSVYVVNGKVLTPFYFLMPVLEVKTKFYDNYYLALFSAALSLVFLWIAVTMTVRRLKDAGMGQWCFLFLFVPF